MVWRVAIAVGEEERAREIARDLTRDLVGFDVRVWGAQDRIGQSARAWAADLVLCVTSRTRPLGDVVRELREVSRAPILAVMTREDEGDVVESLRLGADDCIQVPYSVPELSARLDAHLRRRWEWAALSTDKAPAWVELDDLSRSVVVRQQQVQLTPAETRLLDCLTSRQGGVVTREELRRLIWDLSGETASDGQLNLYIHSLRKKLEQDPHRPQVIRTKWGVGYYVAAGVRKA